MFSQLGPLFKTTFRKAENNDTRLGVPHEERDQRRRRRQQEHQEVDNDPWQDNMTVTVSALRAFLIEFLKTLPGGEDVVKATHQEENIKEVYERPHEQTRPRNTQNAKAVRAYQSMAFHAPSIKPESDNSPPSKRRVAPTADLLQSKELRDIYSLIEELDRLEERNIQTLEINKADSFLEALKEAVFQALKT